MPTIKNCIAALTFCCALSFSAHAFAEEAGSSILQSVTNHLSDIWNNGKYEFMFPVRSYHSPLSYSAEKRKEYNEKAVGLGFGKYIQPTPDRRYGLAFMTFQDSFNKPEPTIYYSWQALWCEDKDLRPTAGFIAGFTFRDNYSWIPVPGAAPTVGVDYKAVSAEVLYVPFFDVFLAWLTVRF